MEKVIKVAKVWKCYKLFKVFKEYRRKRRKRLWSKRWLLRRDERLLGVCHLVHDELFHEDEFSYKNFLRMDVVAFNKLHEVVKDKITRRDTQLRQAISSKFRLTVTLRFLSTGETFQSLSYSTRIAVPTISVFVPEVLHAIYDSLKDEYMKVPSTSNEWQAIAKEFYNKWNVPNTIGAIDGKHITFRPPRSAGSHYYNYKGTHSIVLLAVADANYNFIYIDVGCNGRISDGGVFADCDFSWALDHNLLNLPDDAPLPGLEENVPFVLLADAAFPLKKHIMKPYPYRNMTREDKIFNYRLSRGRRVIENAFGILANRFRVLLNPINLQRDKVVLITQACCVLHNFLLRESQININDEATSEEIQEQESRQGHTLPDVAFRRGRPLDSSIRTREIFKHYFNTTGRVEWQDNMV